MRDCFTLRLVCYNWHAFGCKNKWIACSARPYGFQNLYSYKLGMAGADFKVGQVYFSKNSVIHPIS